MVLDDDVETDLVGDLGQAAETVGGEFLLFLKRSLAGGVDADRVAAERFGGLEPADVVLDGLGAFFFIGRTDPAFAVDHDQELLDAVVVGPAVEFGEVGHVSGLLFEEAADVLDRAEAEAFSGDAGEVEIGHLAGLDRAVERPFCEGDAEKGLGTRGRHGTRDRGERAGGHRGAGGQREQRPAGEGGVGSRVLRVGRHHAVS